ncbi:alpha/beta hydrolase [Jannaschia aquimarina]|uniref:Alpha/beta hydrolase family protein n=1 Tax=Jannaschia aquimarina TaxID=935700 RepID=A0A0D1CTY4_9RHOB|nr:alpha/beta fold hydrolase [Jannaschia aquimarina]KIT18227.1 Alpha/beta hydrolase family protein [Jannaschia aquimarina]SNS82928.1 Esterase/lipase superfamily enzyme [Jannaschia aquimarina]
MTRAEQCLGRRQLVVGGALLLALGACAPRMRFVESSADGPAASTIQRIHLLAADRPIRSLRIAGGGSLTATIVDVSIPPNHRPGEVEYRTDGDPARSFAVESLRGVASAGALADTALAARRPGQDVNVFVHGYNNTTAEAVFRHAQIAHDYAGAGPDQGPQILFHWPSTASPLGYLADRDATLAARADLATLLARLTSGAPGRVLLIAHSMGAFLAMEALARLSSDDPSAIARLSGIILVSPDIGLPVFLDQLNRVSGRPGFFVVAINQADRILGLSAFLTRQPDRLGSTDEVRLLEARGLTVVDLTALRSGSGDHLTLAASPAAIRLINGFSEGRSLRDRGVLKIGR